MASSNSVATFEHGDGGDSFEVGYDMLLAADGAKSRVRSILEREVPDFTVRQREVSVKFLIVCMALERLIYFIKRLVMFVKASLVKASLNGGCLAFIGCGACYHAITISIRQDHMAFKTIPIPIMNIAGAEEGWRTKFHTFNSKIGCLLAPARWGTWETP